MRLSSVQRLWRKGAIVALPLAAAALFGLGAPPVVLAADNPTVVDHEHRIQELEDTIKQLKKDERQLEVNTENQKPLAGWDNGFYISSADGNNKLKIGGYTQLDGRFFLDDKNSSLTNQFLFRRARLDISGTVFKYFDFRILPDFAQPNSSSSVVLFDAFVVGNFIPEIKPLVGKFKPPVGLERLQSAKALLFVERAQPTNLVPNRDFGGQLFGDLLNGAFSYQLAVVNGVPDNVNPTSGDANDDKDFDGRIFTVPFKDAPIDVLKGLGLGVAGSYGRQRGNTSTTDTPTYKTFGQATYFAYKGAVAATSTTPAQGPTIAYGERSRYAPQAYYYFGPLGLFGEYVDSTQGVKRDNKTESLANNAWQVAASFVVTGEAASYNGVVPANPFDPFTGKWGAFEIAGRYGQLEVDTGAFKNGYADPSTSARRDKEWVVGGNWYLNRAIKLSLDYANSDFLGGAPKNGDRSTEKAIVGQVQLAF